MIDRLNFFIHGSSKPSVLNVLILEREENRRTRWKTLEAQERSTTMQVVMHLEKYRIHLALDYFNLLRFPTILQHPASKDHTVLLGKPFGISLIPITYVRDWCVLSSEDKLCCLIREYSKKPCQRYLHCKSPKRNQTPLINFELTISSR